MRKTDKKVDNALRRVLTNVCDIAQGESEGFTWLTHFANYDDFPRSLFVVCVYHTEADLANANLDRMRALIQSNLASIGINIKDMRKHVGFDTEEQCAAENNGRWNERFR